MYNDDIGGFAQYCSISFANTLGLLQSYTKPTVWFWSYYTYVYTDMKLTHWGRVKIAAFSQTMHSNARSWREIYEFYLKFDWSLFLRIQLIIFQHWFRQWLRNGRATSRYLNQWWYSFLKHICVTRPQWVNKHVLQLLRVGQYLISIHSNGYTFRRVFF